VIDVDDALLGSGDVIVGGLNQPDQDVLDVLADVAGLGQHGGIGDGEGDVQVAGQRLGQQGLAHAGGTDQQDIALFQIHIVRVGLIPNAFVMVIDGDGQRLFGSLLTDDVLVQIAADLFGRRQGSLGLLGPGLGLQQLSADTDALLTDIDGMTGDQPARLRFRLSAEGALLIPILILILFCCHPTTTCWKKEKGRCAVRRQGPESSRWFIAFTAA
jgi:hypothetical protein